MTIGFIFLFLSSVIIVLHVVKQKKSLLTHKDIANALLLQLDIENQKKDMLSNKGLYNCNQKINFKLDILKQQVNLLEVISNQTN